MMMMMPENALHGAVKIQEETEEEENVVIRQFIQFFHLREGHFPDFIFIMKRHYLGIYLLAASS